MLVSWPTGTTVVPSRLPSTRTSTSALPPAAAPKSSTRSAISALLADDGEARGVDDGELAVALAALARDQRLQRRVHGKLVGGGASCTSPSVIRMAPAIALGRHIGQRAVQRGESLGAVVLAGRGGGDAGFAHLEVGLGRAVPVGSAPAPRRPARAGCPRPCSASGRSTSATTSGKGARVSCTRSADWPARTAERQRPAPRAQAPRAPRDRSRRA